MKVALCASTAFYNEVISLSDELDTLGVTPILPQVATEYKKAGKSYDPSVIDWSEKPVDYHTQLIHDHFENIAASNAILVINGTKNGQPNYIGPNVLMEMAIAFYLKKHIYVLNGPPEDSPLIDEVLGLQPTFLYGAIELMVAR